MIEARSKVTCTESLVRFGHDVFAICERTDKQTNRQTLTHTYTLITILLTLTDGEVNMQRISLGNPALARATSNVVYTSGNFWRIALVKIEGVYRCNGLKRAADVPVGERG